MASKNQVTLTFAGDAQKLEKAFDGIGAAAKDMESKVDSVSRDMTSSFDRAGEGLDGLDDKAGGLEATTRGTMDVMSGFGALAEGDVLQGVTDLGGGVSSLAQGLGSVLVPAMSSAVGWLAKTRVGMLAQAAAAKAVAAAQWLLNIAMSANPIALVIIAIVALVAIFVVAYKRSETFRNIVQGVFRAVSRAATALVDGLKAVFGRVFDIVSGPFRAAFNFVARAWNNTVGRLSWSVPGWVPIIGGRSLSAPRLPTFHQGGIASGAMGREFLAVLRAGEKVTPAAGGGGPGTTVVVERGQGGRVEDALADLVLHLVRTGALVLRVREGRVAV